MPSVINASFRMASIKLTLFYGTTTFDALGTYNDDNFVLFTCYVQWTLQQRARTGNLMTWLIRLHVGKQENAHRAILVGVRVSGTLVLNSLNDFGHRLLMLRYIRSIVGMHTKH